ncbi:MAG: AAA family ATPase [Bacteroidales bacterium]|nr:AAA family ATPase [Bacteroidales bacterium]
MRIYIIGYMGAGKSTTSKKLARRLEMDCYDTDRLFEERYHIAVDNFFKKYDEALYRRLETQILQSTADYDNAVIATGGGTACFNDNMQWMNQNGLTVFLKVSPMTSFHRLSKSKVRRPLVMNKSPEELLEFIQTNYTERMHFYEQAMITAKGEDLDIEALVNDILSFSSPTSTPKG